MNYCNCHAHDGEKCSILTEKFCVTREKCSFYKTLAEYVKGFRRKYKDQYGQYRVVDFYGTIIKEPALSAEQSEPF